MRMTDKCVDWSCPNRTYSGYCKLTACNRHIQFPYDVMYFPIIISGITFYNKEQLINWIKDQQKMRKNEDYGRGIYS